MGWRNDPATEKQLQFAEIISDTLFCEPFTGKTKGEACDYITKHKPEYDEVSKEMNDFYTEYGWYFSGLHDDAGDRV